MKKRIVAVLLVIALLSTTCVGVFAGGGEETNSLAKYTKGTGYVAFGDSTTRGFAATDAWETEGYRFDYVPLSNTDYINNKTYEYLEDLKKINQDAYDQEYSLVENSFFCRNVKGSYTKQIADALGCYSPDNMTIKDANYWPMAFDAQTTDNVLDILGIQDNFEDIQNKTITRAKSRFQSWLYYFGGDYSFSDMSYLPNGKPTTYGVVNDMRSIVNNASLISLGLGMGEVINRPQLLALDGRTIDDAPEIITDLVEYLYEGYDNFVNHYALLLDYIKENNPNATVVIIGAYNPIYGMTISDETIMPIGNALSSITMLMNQQYKKWAEEYGYIYVDISNVDIGAVENDTDLISFLNSRGEIALGIPTHPTASGYTQIARMVINALEEKEKEPKENVENIVVDLGRYTNVNYVLVDGKRIDSSQYSVENYKLTVKCNNQYAKSLTVAVVDGSKKKTSLMAYQLTYDHGYTAYRCYQTNDVSKTLSKPVSLLKKAGNWFVSLFK